MENFGSYHDFSLIKKIFPDSITYILSFPHFSIKTLPKKMLLSPSNPKNLFSLISQFFSFIRAILANKKLLKKIDLVIDLSGDTLNDQNYRTLQVPLSFLNLLPVIILKKPIIFFFQSIGPIKNTFNKKIAKYILEKAELVIVRESGSYDFLLNELKIAKTKVIYCRTPFLEKLSVVERKFIGILVDSNFANVLQRKKINPVQYYEKIIRIVRGYQKNSQIILIPQVIGPSKVPVLLKDVDDRKLIKKILDIDKNCRAVNPKNLGEFLIYLKKCKFCISSRFHSTFFLIQLNIPFLCFSYSKKTEALLNDCNMNSHMLKIN